MMNITPAMLNNDLLTRSNADFQALRLAQWVAGNPGAKRGDIASGLRISGISQVTIYRWLHRAVEMGLLTRSGRTSSSIYSPTERLSKLVVKAHLARPLNERPPIGYNFDFLRDYRPNLSHLLSKEDLRRLEQRCPIGAAPLSQAKPGEIKLFISEISYASSKLEGSEYTLADTIALEHFEREAADKNPRDAQIARNHYGAAKWLIGEVLDQGHFDLNAFNIRALHAHLASQLVDPKNVGTLRRSDQVAISSSSYTPLSIPAAINDAFAMIVEKAREIRNPYEASFFLLVHLSYLQGFIDCNKRTARMVCNIPLLNAGVNPISWMEASRRENDYIEAMIAIYELNDPILLREVFVDSFMRSAERFDMLKRERDPNPLSTRYHEEIRRIVQGVIKSGQYSEPKKVPAQDVQPLKDHISEELRNIVRNPMIGLRYELAYPTLFQWSVQQQELADLHAEQAGGGDSEDASGGTSAKKRRTERQRG